MGESAKAWGSKSARFGTKKIGHRMVLGPSYINTSSDGCLRYLFRGMGKVSIGLVASAPLVKAL